MIEGTTFGDPLLLLPHANLYKNGSSSFSTEKMGWVVHIVRDAESTASIGVPVIKESHQLHWAGAARSTSSTN